MMVKVQSNTMIKNTKPWLLPIIRWAVFEREPRMNSIPNTIMGPYLTEDMAIHNLRKYFDSENYYTGMIKEL